jgi:putative redox protein
MCHGIRFLAQFQQGMCDSAGYIKEGQVADFATGLAQTGGQLCGEFQQYIRIFPGNAAESGIADFSDLAFAPGPDPGAAIDMFPKQAHFPEESTGVDIGKHDFVAVLVLDQDAYRTLYDEIKDVRLVPCIDDHAFTRILAPVAMIQKPLHAGIDHLAGDDFIIYVRECKCLHAHYIGSVTRGFRIFKRLISGAESVIGFRFYKSGHDGMKARIKWVEAATFLGESGSGHAVVMDGPPEGGGRDLGIRPMEMLLLGMGGCTAYDVVHILKKSRQPVTDCVVELVAERAEIEPKVFTRIHAHFVVTGNGLLDKQVRRAVELSAGKYCSASIMLGKVADITHDFEIRAVGPVG